MTKLQSAFNALAKMGYKVKMKENEVKIKGFKVIAKGETLFTYNHKGELVSYGYNTMTALTGIVKGQ